MSELVDKDKVMEILFNVGLRCNHGKYVHKALREIETSINQLDTYDLDTQDEKGLADPREPETPLDMDLYNLACKYATQDDKLHETQKQIDRLEEQIDWLEDRVQSLSMRVLF